MSGQPGAKSRDQPRRDADELIKKALKIQPPAKYYKRGLFYSQLPYLPLRKHLTINKQLESHELEKNFQDLTP
jgi:hypothetical protein